jgi:hypothetical protein
MVKNYLVDRSAVVHKNSLFGLIVTYPDACAIDMPVTIMIHYISDIFETTGKRGVNDAQRSDSGLHGMQATQLSDQ